MRQSDRDADGLRTDRSDDDALAEQSFKKGHRLLLERHKDEIRFRRHSRQAESRQFFHEIGLAFGVDLDAFPHVVCIADCSFSSNLSQGVGIERFAQAVDCRYDFRFCDAIADAERCKSIGFREGAEQQDIPALTKYCSESG